MSQRPGFPVKLSQTGASSRARKTPAAAPTRPLTKPSPVVASTPGVKGPATRQPAPVSGLGLDSGAVRARMVRKLAEQGVQDARVLEAMGRVERHRAVQRALGDINTRVHALALDIG